MRVGFFFNPPRRWDWQRFQAGEIGLSGTDAQVLRVAHHLSQRDGLDIVLLQGQPPTEHARMQCVQVASAEQAVAKAKALGLSVLVINNRGDDDTRRAIAACDATNLPVVVWDQNGPDENMADVLAASSAVKRLVCVSATQCDGVRHHPVFDKAEFIYNTVDPLFFTGAGGQRDDHNVVFLGSLTPAKGFHLLAAAWPGVRRAVPRAQLTVLGSAQLYDDHARLGPLAVAEVEYETQHLVPHLGQTRAECLEHGVHFRGLVSPVEIRESLLHSLIGVVNPNSISSLETFCVGAVEMQACGAAVVGGRGGGLLETVRHRKTGILVRGHRQLEGALIELLEDPSRARAMGQRGIRFVTSRFAPGAVGDRWVRLLQDVAAGTRAHPPAFAFRRLSRGTFVREALRQSRSLPIVGHRVPTLGDLRHLRKSLRLRPR